MPKFRAHAVTVFDADQRPTNSHGDPVIATHFSLVVDAKRAEDVFAMTITGLHGPKGLIVRRFGRDLKGHTKLTQNPVELIVRNESIRRAGGEAVKS